MIFVALIFVVKVFKVLVLIASSISQRENPNKQPQQASINSWLQPGLPLFSHKMTFCEQRKSRSNNTRRPHLRDPEAGVKRSDCKHYFYQCIPMNDIL